MKKTKLKVFSAAMAQIKILPEILSNQIAAGEVVQRPSSVVKELVENSMDAGATRISIEIEKGGRSLIRISDNGCGLARDQAMLAVERYATSKIYSKEDLFSISTFGFRGEALPSIASVSKFSLVSRQKGEEGGTRVDIAGGRLLKVADAGAPVGTMVEVKQLFFNTPARRKFLKTETTEAGHISDAVSGLALGNPGIGFRLFFNKKLVRNFPPGQSLFSRAQMVLGRDAGGRIYEFDSRDNDFEGGDRGGENNFQNNEIRLSGVCSHPGLTRSTPGKLYFFVNKRLVHDRGLVAAVFQGYRGRIMKGRYPLGVVRVELPCDLVDVNVHPTKREIKFLDPRPVYKALGQAVAKALSKAQEDVLSYARSAPVSFTAPFKGQNYQENLPFVEKGLSGGDCAPAGALDIPRAFPGQTGSEDGPPGAGEPGLKTEGVRQQEAFGMELMEGRASFAGPGAGRGRTGQVPEPLCPGAESNSPEEESGSVFSGQDISSPSPWADISQVKILGQALGTYIVVEKDNTLVLVDQHAAHERVVYEALKKRHKTLGIQSQALLVPEVLELSHKEADILNGIMDDIADLGICMEPFGGTSFVIKSIPVLVKESDLKPLIYEVIDILAREKDFASKDAWYDACLISMACHRAIRANKSMEIREMTKLMEDLSGCDNPMHCPHGRPVLISFDAGQLERLFKRVV